MGTRMDPQVSCFEDLFFPTLVNMHLRNNQKRDAAQGSSMQYTQEGDEWWKILPSFSSPTKTGFCS